MSKEWLKYQTITEIALAVGVAFFVPSSIIGVINHLYHDQLFPTARVDSSLDLNQLVSSVTESFKVASQAAPIITPEPAPSHPTRIIMQPSILVRVGENFYTCNKQINNSVPGGMSISNGMLEIIDPGLVNGWSSMEGDQDLECRAFNLVEQIYP